MAWTINPFYGRLDAIGRDVFKGVLAAAPSNPQNGWQYINSVDNIWYIYYGGQWNETFTLAPSIVPAVGSPIGLLISLTYAT